MFNDARHGMMYEAYYFPGILLICVLLLSRLFMSVAPTSEKYHPSGAFTPLFCTPHSAVLHWWLEIGPVGLLYHGNWHRLTACGKLGVRA